MIDICCNVNTINTKEGDDLKITMQIKLQPTKEEMALLDFTMQEYISLVNLYYTINSDLFQFSSTDIQLIFSIYRLIERSPDA